jgi:protein involved in polysaccharide export with SLBB domain
MYLSKVRNSDLISKVLLIIIIFTFSTLNSIAQNTQTQPQVVPNGKAVQNVPLPAKGAPAPIVGERTLEMTENELELMTHEDSVILANNAIENEDLDLQALRRKIFGHKLFNIQTYNPNAIINIPTPNNYVLGSNDKLDIDIYGYSQFHEELTINPDGFITLQRAGLVKISGMTIEDATIKIKSALAKIYLGLLQGNTKLNVSLSAVRSIKITITGEVIAPGSYTMSSLSTLTSALYRCGGPNEIGSFREIQVIRNNKVAATLDLYDILMKGFSANDILLKDQDIILIPTFKNRVIINGETKRSGYFELINSENLSNAIYYAGGFSPNAYTKRVKLYRNNSTEKEIFDVEKQDFESFQMMRGDSIFVNTVLERFSNLLTIEGAVYRPGQYSMASNKTLSDLIVSSDGLLNEALIGRISIYRTNYDLTTSSISVNYKDILNGTVPDIELQREDRIIVPSMFDLTEVSFVKIRGAINNENAAESVEIPFIKNLTLEDLIVQVGGLTEAASLTTVEIVRRKKNVDISKGNALTSEIIILNLSRDFDKKDNLNEVILQPFDEIFVRVSPNYKVQTYVEIQGEIVYPSVYGIASKEERISDLIKRAGGLTLQAYAPGATLVRTVKLSAIEIEQKKRTINDLATTEFGNQVIATDEIAETREEFIDIDLKGILIAPHSAGDLILNDGDVIKIPKLLETVRVQGEVLYPTTVKYLKKSTFKNYISSAGGFTRKSLKGKSYVLYPNGSVDRTRKFLAFNFYPKIEPGSEIIVPQRIKNNAEQLTVLANTLGTLSATLGTIFSIYGFIRLGK